MTTEPTTTELRARLDALGRRIEDNRHKSAAETGVPYAGGSWKDIVASHGKLVQQIASERASTHDLHRIKADVEALSLSLDGWLKRIDSHFSTAGKK